MTILKWTLRSEFHTFLRVSNKYANHSDSSQVCCFDSFGQLIVSFLPGYIPSIGVNEGVKAICNHVIIICIKIA